jgi:uncharacterized delta-60 repeat protein
VSLGTFCLLFLSLSLSVFAKTATIAVKSAAPSTASQGTSNLNVSISGSGFAKGDSAVFYLTGTTNAAGIAVNSTAFVSSTKVTANINIAATATISSFDIVVKNTTGSSGKGTKLFKVTAAVSPSACTVPAANVTGPSNCISKSTAPGCLDSTFGTQVSGIGLGYVLTDATTDLSGNDNGNGQDIVIQPGTGNIYSVGEWDAGAVGDQVTLVRYTPAGVLDTTFGCNTLTYANSSCPGAGVTGFNSPGIVKVPLPSNVFINVASLQPNGQILAAGWSGPFGSPQQLLVVRFNPDGSLDDLFGTNGVVQIAGATGAGVARDMAVQPDGKIVLVGNNVVRLNTDGTLDTTFGATTSVPGTGVVLSPTGGLAYSVALQTVEVEGSPQTMILVGGLSAGSEPYYSDSLLFRLTSAGGFDTTFGPSGTGVTLTDTCGGRSNIVGLAFDSSTPPNIIAGGWATIDGGIAEFFAVSKYSANGILDTLGDFGGQDAGPGTSILASYGGSPDNQPYGMLVQADGSIVLMGSIFGNFVGAFEYVLVRFTSTGLPDTTFGTGGVVVPEIGLDPQYGEYGYRGRLDSTGKIVMTGSVENPGDLNAVARFLP